MMDDHIIVLHPDFLLWALQLIDPEHYEVTPAMKREPPFVNLFDGEITKCPRCLTNYLKPNPDENIWVPLEDVEGYDLSFQVCAACGEEMQLLEADRIRLTGDIQDREDNLAWHIAHLFDNV